jgi:uncharacterized membrane protein
MLDGIRSALSRNKYGWAIFLILSMATVFCILVLRIRIVLSASYQYSFLAWNLFLAWIPFGIAFVTHLTALGRKTLAILIPISALLWLLFFPNAPYILTDLQHLSQQVGKAPIWYDVIMLIWFAWTGLLLGVISLYLMQELVRREFGRLAGWVFVLGVASLSSAGIYIGRFIRWNSWDVLRHPFGTAAALMDYAVDPSLRSIGFIGLYTLFFIFVYMTLYAFGHLVQERPDKIV